MNVAGKLLEIQSNANAKLLKKIKSRKYGGTCGSSYEGKPAGIVAAV